MNHVTLPLTAGTLAILAGTVVSTRPTPSIAVNSPVRIQTAPNALSEAERKAGWKLLFDGRTLDGWLGYREEATTGWAVVDGAIARVGAGSDLITRQVFRDFELSVDWNVEEGSNSGIFYRAVLGLDEIYEGAPEMQVLDDAHHSDGRSPLTSAGSTFGLYAVSRSVVHPPGEWNTARILVQGNHVEHWLNGWKVVEYELHSDDWKRRVADSKFAAWPAYGMAEAGRLGLQNHGDAVMFRNIKVRVIDQGSERDRVRD